MATPIESKVPEFLVCCDSGEGDMVIISQAADAVDALYEVTEAKKTVQDIYVYRLVALMP